MTAVETVERVHIAPLRARVDGMLDEVQAHDRQGQARCRSRSSDAFRHIAGTGSMVAGAVRSRTWPIIGIIQGIRDGSEHGHEERQEGRPTSRALRHVALAADDVRRSVGVLRHR